MSVQDLTNTTWVFNDYLTYPGEYFDHAFNINFTSNNTSYTAFNTYVDGGDELNIHYGDDFVYIDSNGWDSSVYKTITITGGNDAVSTGTNFSTLVTWLETNATQQTISQLTVDLALLAGIAFQLAHIL